MGATVTRGMELTRASKVKPAVAAPITVNWVNESYSPGALS